MGGGEELETAEEDDEAEGEGLQRRAGSRRGVDVRAERLGGWRAGRRRARLPPPEAGSGAGAGVVGAGHGPRRASLAA